MRIAFAGHSGFIGSKIKKAFSEYSIIPLNRKDLYGNINDLAKKISEADIVMNFAGNSISRPWTKKNKLANFKSRIILTDRLVAAINLLEKKPALLINASAIGIYKYDLTHTETDCKYADNYLAELVKQWESSADHISPEVRLIKPRLGMVLGTEGGAFPPLLGIFKKGAGGSIGSGRQVYSFIHIDDLLGALKFLIDRKKSSGVYNFTAPNPVSNLEFTQTLKEKIKKRAMFHVPEWTMKLLLGEASEIITKGQTVLPARLLDEGYKFTFATFDEALENLLKKE